MGWGLRFLLLAERRPVTGTIDPPPLVEKGGAHRTRGRNEDPPLAVECATLSDPPAPSRNGRGGIEWPSSVGWPSQIPRKEARYMYISPRPLAFFGEEGGSSRPSYDSDSCASTYSSHSPTLANVFLGHVQSGGTTHILTIKQTPPPRAEPLRMRRYQPFFCSSPPDTI